MFKWLKIGRADSAAVVGVAAAPEQPATFPPDVERANAFRIQGNDFLEADRFAEAALCYEQAIALNPGDAAALVNLGFAQCEMGLPLQARESLQQATALDDTNQDAFHLLGMAFEQSGELAAAAQSFARAVQLQPDFEPARQELCRVLFRCGKPDQADVEISEAARRFPRAAWPYLFRGNLKSATGCLAEASASYAMAVSLAPQDASLHSLLGTALQQQGHLAQAVASYAQAVRLQPNHAEALSSMGNALRQQGRLAEAIDACQRALAIDATLAAAHNNLGTAHVEAGDASAALASFDRAIALQPGFTQALGNRGAALQALKRHDEALASFDAALALDPALADALNNRGNTLLDMGRPEDALASYEAALRGNPDDPQALNNKGNALHSLCRLEEALKCHEAAVAIQPGHVQAINNIGNLLAEMNRPQEAVAAYDRALLIDPVYAEALVNRGNAQRNLGRIADALDSYEQALALRADLPWVYGNWLHARMLACDWRDLDSHFANLAVRVASGQQAFNPFTVLATNLTLAEQLQCARTYVQLRHPSHDLPPSGPPRAQHARIRLGYFSADFHEHATAWLMAQLFELHDRTHFELIAFSFGPDVKGPMRKRLQETFDQFHIVNARSDREVALLARELEVDIAIDLKGFTQNSRPGIFAFRPAPVQVSYLGYPGTMGAQFIDYLVADATVVPPEHQPFYTEKIVTLPHCYQVNDAKRKIASDTPTREQAGLPDGAFVFCCFNNNFKITPDLFDVWMRLLREVPCSVLWLLEGSRLAAQNLRVEAQARGINPARLVFAGRTTLPEHLARHRLADLFLDTTWCNAHTTASDSLWAGLPVLTLIGGTFAGRVAASLNRAVGLPEMVTVDLAGYQAQALALARDRTALAELKARLAENLHAQPLFDTALFALHLEAAFTAMWQRHASGQAPEHFTVMPTQV
jgi:protein O-GlcNAc transferase